MSEQELVKVLEREAEQAEPLDGIKGYMELSRWAKWHCDSAKAEHYKQLARKCLYTAVLTTCPTLKPHIDALED